jgi:uncharacterized protein YtpQ (UPF0354 family)
MDELELTPDSLHALAVSNLPNRIPPLEVHGESPRRMATCGGNFEATLLLHEGLWEHVSSDTKGDILAVVPARDMLVISDSAWDGALDFLSGIVNQEFEDKRYLLSKAVLARRGGTWVLASANA